MYEGEGSDSTLMRCPYCKGEIIDGAVLCRFCRKKQPLKGLKARHQKEDRRLKIYIGAGAGVLILIVAMTASYQDRQARLEAAARCSGMTYTQLEDVAKVGAERGGMSIAEAEDAAARLACPSLD